MSEWCHETSITVLVSIYKPNFITCFLEIRCRASGKRVPMFSQWIRKQTESIRECISSFSFGHRNQSRWWYPGADWMCRSAWKLIIQLSRLRADKHAYFGFVLLAPEHFTSGAQFHSSQLLLENAADWREWCQHIEILYLLYFPIK